MAAADRAGGGQVEPVLGGFLAVEYFHFDLDAYCSHLLKK
jgi:hypothetical protein